MVDYTALKKRLQELAERSWNGEAIRAWFHKLTTEDIPRKTILRDEAIARKAEILDRVQGKAEECEFLSHS
jgi:ribosomal protein L16 Arg81 hydroxylase